MVYEQAVLSIRSGQEAEFEAAFATAKSIIAASPGFRNLTLARCMEVPNSYLFVVEWERLEDHTHGFRGSPAFEEWRRLLHHFYDPAPLVQHFEPVATA